MLEGGAEEVLVGECVEVLALQLAEAVGELLWDWGGEESAEH